MALSDEFMAGLIGSGDVTAFAEALTKRIKRQAQDFVKDNFRKPSPSDFLIIENAMLSAASATMALQTEFDAAAVPHGFVQGKGSDQGCILCGATFEEHWENNGATTKTKS